MRSELAVADSDYHPLELYKCRQYNALITATAVNTEYHTDYPN